MRAAAFAVAYLACVAHGQPVETQDALEPAKSLASLLVGLHPEAAFNPSMMHPTLAVPQNVAQLPQPVMSGHKLWPKGHKTSHSMRKRFKPTSTGKLLFHRAGKAHLLRKKRPEHKQRLRRTMTVADGQIKTYTDNFRIRRWYKERLRRPKKAVFGEPGFVATEDMAARLNQGSVRFETEEEAIKAVKELFGTELKGNELRVFIKPKNKKGVNVYNLPPELSHEELKEVFSKAGTVKYTGIKSPSS
mmetsp:Transcript_55972/g.105462  ORF Transcript_55972/g.105462 Transcript_55972/m.105462 type:complete len:246 (-) Transcript_55972:131-868(-)